MLPYQKRKNYALPFVATSTWSPSTDWACIIIIPLLQRRRKWILILFLALQRRWKSAVKEKWEQQPSGGGKLFTNLFLALKQREDVGIAVSWGRGITIYVLYKMTMNVGISLFFFWIKTHICLQESMSQDLTCWSSGQGAKIQHASEPKNQNVKTEAIL